MKSIIFSPESVRAILDGRKTMTRRVIIPQPYHLSDCVGGRLVDFGNNDWACSVCGGDMLYHAPYSRKSGIHVPYQAGDILYVREKFLYNPPRKDLGLSPYLYYADAEEEVLGQAKAFGLRWHSPIFMPKEAARIFLRVTDVRAERLQDITEEDARREGVKDPYEYQDGEWYEQKGLTQSYYHDAFAGLWDSLNAKRGYGWDTNPWVWVIEFRPVARD